jgi:NADPH:quinone reductase-like Zn-dependent oxidoreductase
VAVLNARTGSWGEQAVVSARQAIPVWDDLPEEQAAAFFVNPATALVMTRFVLQVPRGAWLLQTAAASALGRMIIRLARHDGYRTINVVRRRDQAEELRRLGGDEVIATESEAIDERVRQITQGAGVPFAVDAVGGAMGLGALQALGANGRLLAYGTLSGEPIAVDPRRLIAGQKRMEGFWLSEWAQQQRVLTMLKLFKEINRLLRADVLTTPVQATFPMEQIQEAVRLAETSGRHGKVLVRLSAS